MDCTQYQQEVNRVNNLDFVDFKGALRLFDALSEIRCSLGYAVFELYGRTNMGHNEIPNTAMKPEFLSPSPFHFSTSLSSFKGIRVAQKRKSVCVSMLRVSRSKRRWDMTSSFILPSALALWGQALFLSHLHSTILFSFFSDFFFMSQVETRHDWEWKRTGAN